MYHKQIHVTLQTVLYILKRKCIKTAMFRIPSREIIKKLKKKQIPSTEYPTSTTCVVVIRREWTNMVKVNEIFIFAKIVFPFNCNIFLQMGSIESGKKNKCLQLVNAYLIVFCTLHAKHVCASHKSMK